ncbi:MAG: hypothetical protein ACI8ZO_001094 [Flavobacteriales bacterium]|jgi:hypothetical protein
MKKVLLSLGVIATAFAATAQITVTSTNLPVMFDAFETATDSTNNENVINPGNAGANQSWDFSSVTAETITGTGFIDPASTDDAADFPTATLAADFQGQMAYFRTSTDGMFLLGFGGGDFAGKYEPENTLIKMPVTFGDSYSDNTSLNVDFEDTFTGTHDSLRYARETERDVDVDAWGTVILPSSSYDALRLNIEETNTVRIYGKDSTVLGWGDWTYDPILTESFGGGNAIVTNIFQWYTNDVNVITTLVDMVYQPDSVVVVPEFTYAYFTPQSINELPNATVSVYPNPASNMVTLELNEIVTGYAKVYNMNGQVVATQVMNGTSISIALDAIANGTYFVNIMDANGSVKSVNQINVAH